MYVCMYVCTGLSFSDLHKEPQAYQLYKLTKLNIVAMMLLPSGAVATVLGSACIESKAFPCHNHCM